MTYEGWGPWEGVKKDIYSYIHREERQRYIYRYRERMAVALKRNLTVSQLLNVKAQVARSDFS